MVTGKRRLLDANPDYVCHIFAILISAVIFLVEGEEQRKSICINPGTQAKGQGGGTFAELKYHGSPDKMNASITIGIQILDLNSVRDVPNSKWQLEHKIRIKDPTHRMFN
ncbi:hypothetical protein D5086_016999 [Populus alba]|uniref:Uncharacterized protein n=1 Tax=Populus alba TaxID=43335 RepID=A0ACC4BWV9_POPAL